MREQNEKSRGLLTFIAAILALVLLTGVPGYTDDTDLLRKNTAKPYLMLMLDTSSSMNLKLAGPEWLPLGGDDPRSRINAAKRALYEVFRDQSRVNYGFMTFNQDELRVRAKHWLYAPTTDPSWSLRYPLAPVGAGAEATDDSFTLGREVQPGAGGSCTDPLDLNNAAERAMVSRYPKLGEDGSSATSVWAKSSGNTYLVTISAPNINTEPLGSPSMTLALSSRLVASCSGLDPTGAEGPVFEGEEKVSLAFRLVGEHLMEDRGNRLKDDGIEGGGDDIEDHAGFWDWQDAVTEATCSEGAPFSGKGLESNYDDPQFAPPGTPSAFPSSLESFLSRDDEYCGETACDDLKFRTFLDPKLTEYRELDRGDLIPYHWDISGHEDVLSRLNPNHGKGLAPDFGVSAFFTDTTTGSRTGYLSLRDRTRRPLMAAGETPFGKMINDYRCWYLGPNVGPAGKCREGSSRIPFEEGWQQIAELYDPDYVCRRPYMILITDGEDTCGGENPTADINDLDGFGVSTWVINLGGRAAERRLQSILSTTKADIITLEEGSDASALKGELLKILGVIESESRSFAAAAVPSVQTEDEQKIFLTSFSPFNSSSVWSGQALAFLKPLPLRTVTDSEGVTQQVPDTSQTCDAATTESCFLWDAGEVLKTQINADPFGPAENQRRVFYPRADPATSVPLAREPFALSTASGLGTDAERDFWRGLGVPFIEGVAVSEDTARAEANGIVDFTYSMKTALLSPGDPASEVEFILGDNFHAEPVIVSAPVSNQLFIQNYEDYRDFAVKHQYRRKMFFVPTNDGMLHIFDSGIPRKVSSGGQVQVEYDRGSGREIAAYIPRSILPTINSIAGSSERPWSVDGGLRIADVFIDPLHAGTPSDSNREWRTVLVAGLRRGGEAVYALDITQPDKLTEVTVTEPFEETVLIPDLPAGATLANCWNAPGDGNLGCDEDVRFPQPLWEFADTVEWEGQFVRLDEDRNGEPDFAQSWSRPNIGRIQVEENGTIVDKFVAVFGGGLDPELPNVRGNWLYMIDIETGKTIYKEPLLGSAASEPAAVDTDQDGLLDRVYIGTTSGFLYRLDLGADTDGRLPVLDSYTLIVDVGGVLRSIPGEKRISGREPTIVFDNIDSTTGNRLPLYFRPSVIFSPLLNPNFALAFGDGDREDLWSRMRAPGRFFLFVDDTDQFGGPITPDSLQKVLPESATSTSEFLFQPGAGNRRGWYIELDVEERVISDAFSLSGIVVFSSYQPQVEDLEDPENSRLRLCSRQGDSRTFAVLATNANGVLFDANSDRTRSMTVNTLVSKAFADLATKQQPPSGDDTIPPEPPELPPDMQLVMDELKKLFPSNCRFANYRIDIRAVAADTEVVDIAPVPVCIIEKNWREF